MTKRVLTYSAIGLLALALLAGTSYALLNPTEVRAERGAIEDQGPGRGNGGAGTKSSGQSDDARGQADALSAEEIEGILYMREEEKLARDVYLTLYERWDLAIFQNIANSEQTHMDAIKRLIDRYGLDDPAAGSEVGEFVDPTLQSLYDDLVATGSRSLADALQVGAAIEEIDIVDLERYIAQTEARDIQQVYESLARGSRNHLRAFISTLEQQTGASYAAQYLSSEAYDGIISTAVESGGNGAGAPQSDGRGSGRAK